MCVDAKSNPDEGLYIVNDGLWTSYVFSYEDETFDILKNMWRTDKGYFKNLWLKPMDDRVINKFGLTKTFEKYEYLMDGSNYTKKNIDEICDAIKSTPNGLKCAICDKVKSLVISGEITNISVIRELEKRLHIDLVSFLD